MFVRQNKANSCGCYSENQSLQCQCQYFIRELEVGLSFLGVNLQPRSLANSRISQPSLMPHSKTPDLEV